MSGEPDGIKLNGNSYISIGILVLLISATLWIKDGQSSNAAYNKETSTNLEHYKEMQKVQVDLILSKVDTIQKSLDLAVADRYRLQDHKIFVERMKELNPTLRFPSDP